jgi:hypothetical protein
LILDEFGTAQQRLHALAVGVPASAWSQRTDPTRWSIAECVAHLNLTSAAFLPALREALAGARGPRQTAGTRFRRDPIGWLLWRMAGPPVRVRVKTTAPFIPQATATAGELVATFDQWQARLVTLVRESEGLPLSQLWMTSPIDARLRYTVYSCLTILPRHQHRHLWQAEQVWAGLRGSAARHATSTC